MSLLHHQSIIIYYIIGQEVHYIIGQLLHYRLFYNINVIIITVTSDYNILNMIIGCNTRDYVVCQNVDIKQILLYLYLWSESAIIASTAA